MKRKPVSQDDGWIKGRGARAALFRGLAILLLALGAPALAPGTAHAGGVVGDGTPGSCTEAAFNAALSGGGVVTFNCGGAAKLIPLTSVKNITANTRIDGDGRIVLYADPGYYGNLFYVLSYATLELDNLSVQGNATPGVQPLLANPGGHLIVYNSSLYWGYGGAIENNGTLSSLDYNIFLQYNASHCTITGFTANNLMTDPLLGPLALNGGRTRTHALSPGSPAIDDGDPVYGCWYRDLASEIQVITRDQRGVPRPFRPATRCDVGAVEAGWQVMLPLARR